MNKALHHETDPFLHGLEGVRDARIPVVSSVAGRLATLRFKVDNGLDRVSDYGARFVDWVDRWVDTQDSGLEERLARIEVQARNLRDR